MKHQTAVGTHRHLVTVFTVGTAVPDGDGGYTQVVTPLSPATWHCSIVPATQRDLERVTSGTVISTASHVLTGRHHAGITTKTQVIFNGRTFNVTGVSNPEERNIETVAVAVEVVP